jgi:isoquinoline 1-oxidoreductase alpha subunit
MNESGRSLFYLIHFKVWNCDPGFQSPTLCTVLLNFLTSKNNCLIMATFQLIVNGKNRAVEATPNTPLLWVLRDNLNLTGTKYGCGMAQCGACTVHLDGAAVRSCSTPVSVIGNKEVTTIEGISQAEELHPVQQAWMDENVPQCGYCQTGQIMSAVALLRKNPIPSDSDIEAAMSGNICRCGTYERIRKAIKRASNHSAK